MNTSPDSGFDLRNFDYMPISPVGPFEHVLHNAGVVTFFTSQERKWIAITNFLFSKHQMSELSLNQIAELTKLQTACLIAAKSQKANHKMHVTPANIAAAIRIVSIVLPGWQEDFPTLYSERNNAKNIAEKAQEVRKKLQHHAIHGYLESVERQEGIPLGIPSSAKRGEAFQQYATDLNRRIIENRLLDQPQAPRRSN